MSQTCKCESCIFFLLKAALITFSVSRQEAAELYHKDKHTIHWKGFWFFYINMFLQSHDKKVMGCSKIEALTAAWAYIEYLTFNMSRCRKKHATHAKMVSVANKSQCTNDMHVGSAGVTEGALAGEGGGGEVSLQWKLIEQIYHDTYGRPVQSCDKTFIEVQWLAINHWWSVTGLPHYITWLSL